MLGQWGTNDGDIMEPKFGGRHHSNWNQQQEMDRSASLSAVQQQMGQLRSPSAMQRHATAPYIVSETQAPSTRRAHNHAFADDETVRLYYSAVAAAVFL